MGDGAGLMVTLVVVTQPGAMVYETLVIPPASPVSTPDPIPIVAVVGAEELHVPPDVALTMVAVVPAHNNVGPVITDGAGTTVTA